MKTKTKISCALFATVLAFLFVSCTHSDAISMQGEPDTREADCIIDGKKVYFVPDEKKQQWIEPLTKLLANEKTIPIVNGDAIDGYLPPDPDSPSVEKFHECGLFDVTRDGIPELLVWPWGWFGSSGITAYAVYDIYTGQKIGFLDGGMSSTWCAYLNIETEGIEHYNQYWLRGGWSYRERFVGRITYDENDRKYNSDMYLYAAYEIDAEVINVQDDNPDDGLYQGEWVETYPATYYKIFGEEASWDSYYAEYDKFTTKCIRIPETELHMISHPNEPDSEQDREIQARKLAEMLVFSEQEFIDLEE